MWTTFSPFLLYSYVAAPVWWVIVLVVFRAYWWYPICRGLIGPKWFGLRRHYNNTQPRHNRHNLGCCWWKWPPSAPHEALCSTPMPWMDGGQPPKLVDITFCGDWGCVWPLKCSFIPAMMHGHNIGVFWGPWFWNPCLYGPIAKILATVCFKWNVLPFAHCNLRTDQFDTPN